MPVGQICVRGVDVATRDESVFVAARRMLDRNVGSLVIVDDCSRPIGIVTDRDLTLRVTAEARDPHDTSVEDVMSPRVRTVSPETPVERALEIMRSGPYRRLPVIDDDGKVFGMLTIDDVLNDLADEFRRVGSLLHREGPEALVEV